MRGMIGVADIEQKAEELITRHEHSIELLENRAKKINDKEELEEIAERKKGLQKRIFGIMDLLSVLNFGIYLINGKLEMHYNEVDDGHDADYEEQKGDCQWL